MQSTAILSYLADLGYSAYGGARLPVEPRHGRPPDRARSLRETAYLDGPPYGFNVMATKDPSVIEDGRFVVSPVRESQAARAPGASAAPPGRRAVMAAFTVIGGAGFVGSALVPRLKQEGHSCRVPARGEELGSASLGHVVYCAGLTGDWSSRRLDAVDAHVAGLTSLVREHEFDSLLYLSSTRVYDRHPGPRAREDEELRFKPQDADDLYALSKAAGEVVTVAAGGRVARLSNVYGPRLEGGGFLPAILREAVETGRVTLESALDSSAGLREPRGRGDRAPADRPRGPRAGVQRGERRRRRQP